MSDVLNLMQFILKVLESSSAEGLAVSLVNFSAAVFLKQLLGLLLHFLGHALRTLGSDVKQDQAALQHIWEGPGLKDESETKHLQKSHTCMEGTSNSESLLTLLRHNWAISLKMSCERRQAMSCSSVTLRRDDTQNWNVYWDILLQRIQSSRALLQLI